jgi:RNA polymerase sigma factor (sigma-70 family)
MREAAVTTPMPLGPFRSKRLLALAGDDRLVEQIRRGNELAFEVVFERHGAGILAFCRHMLGSREEAEDAVQQTFAAAYSDIQRGGERRIALRAWLYTIARNRCLSILRARREQPAELQDVPTEGLSEQVERRAELRELLADVRELPDEQRAALLLAEAGGLSHAEVAAVLDCEAGAVKGIVFRARSGLIERRVARETPCTEIREQLATLRGGALRRNELRHHLADCPSCSSFRDELRRQRRLLAVALPVTPTLGLKSSVLGGAGLTGGAVGGASAAGGAVLGSAAVAKVALVAVVAGGSVVAGGVAVDRARDPAPARVAPAPAAAHAQGSQARTNGHAPALQGGGVNGETHGAHGARISSERSHGLRGAERRAAARSHGNAYGRSTTAAARKAAKPERPTPPGQSRAAEQRVKQNSQPKANAAPQPPPKAQAQSAPAPAAKADPRGLAGGLPPGQLKQTK